MASRQFTDYVDSSLVVGRDEPPLLSNITLLVAPNAAQAMLEETNRYAAAQQETGGIMIGKWLDSTTAVVLAATNAGPRAEHEQFTFAIDVEYANAELERWVRRYPGVDYLGEWHKHPPALHYPSSGDLYTARHLLSDPGYPNRLVNPITLVHNGRAAIYFYYVDAQMSGFGAIKPTYLTDVDLSRLEPQLQQASSQYGAVFTNVQRRDPAWYTLPAGKARLQQEHDRLEDDVKRGVFRKYDAGKYDDGSWQFTVTSKRNPGLTIQLECYGQYPNQPPRVATTFRGQSQKRASQLATYWNADYHANEVCREIDKNFRSEQSGRVKLLVLLVGLLAVVAVAGLIGFSFLSKPNQTATPIAIVNTSATQTVAALQNANSDLAMKATAIVQTQSENQTAQAVQATAIINNLTVDANVKASANPANTTTATGSLLNSITTLAPTPAKATATLSPAAQSNPYPFTVTFKEVSQAEFNSRCNNYPNLGFCGFHILVELNGNVPLNTRLYFEPYNNPPGYILLPTKAGVDGKKGTAADAVYCKDGGVCTATVKDFYNGKIYGGTQTASSFQSSNYYIITITQK